MREINPFIVHSSLDVLEDVQWTTNQLYLKVIDNYYGYMVSAMCTAGNIRFLLLHKPGTSSSSGGTGSGLGGGSGSSSSLVSGTTGVVSSSSGTSGSLVSASHIEEPIRQFFFDVYDLYVKTLLSPFYFVNQPITSQVFDQKVRALGKKYL